MSLWSRLLGDSARAAKAEAQALEEQISEVIWQAQLGPEQVPRIVRLTMVNRGAGYVLPGTLMPDRKSRLLVNPLTTVNTPATIAQLDAMDHTGSHQ